MTIILSLQTVEELIFLDKEVQKLLPEFSDTFGAWHLGKRGGLNLLSKKALFDFLNNLEGNHIRKLETYFNAQITLRKTDSNLIHNFTMSIDDVDKVLNDFGEFQGDLSISREGNQMYICLWR